MNNPNPECPRCGSDMVNIEIGLTNFPYRQINVYCVHCGDITGDINPCDLDDALRAISLFGIASGLTDTEE